MADEMLSDTERFEEFVRALGKAAERAVSKAQEEKEARKQTRKAEAQPALKGKISYKGVSAKTKKKIISAMKKLNRVMDERDRRYFYFKQKFYELTLRPKEDEKSIAVFLKNLDDELNGYMEWKRNREKKFKVLESKIKKKMETKLKPEKVKQLEQRLAMLKKKYHVLKKSRKKKSRKQLQEIDRIKHRLNMFEKNLRELKKHY